MSGTHKDPRLPPQATGQSGRDPVTPLSHADTGPRTTSADQVRCERCGAGMFRMHAVWRCPACGFKTDCCGW